MTNHSAPPNPPAPLGTPTYRFLRLSAVCKMCGLSRSQIYRMQAAGLFPKSVKLAQSASGWIDTEVMQWQADRIAASRSKTKEPAAAKPSEAQSDGKLALAKLRARVAEGSR